MLSKRVGCLGLSVANYSLNRRGLAVCPRNNLILKAGVDSDVIHSINSSSCDLFKTGGFTCP